MNKNTDKLKILALIPARGGSKGIPKKNIVKLLDKPLISWTIDQGLNSKYINRVIVSTDSNEIGDISKTFGAEVPFIRPSELAMDLSPDIDVFIHALNWLIKNENYKPDLIVHLRATGPARKIKIIDDAIEKMLKNPSADSLRSVSLSDKTPYKMWLLNSEDRMKPVLTLKDSKESHSMPRQFLPKAYWQNGYVDIVKPSTLLHKKSMVGDNVLPFIIKEEFLDIDYPEDLSKVEKLMKFLDKNKEEEFDNFSKEDSNRFPT